MTELQLQFQGRISRDEADNQADTYSVRGAPSRGTTGPLRGVDVCVLKIQKREKKNPENFLGGFSRTECSEICEIITGKISCCIKHFRCCMFCE